MPPVPPVSPATNALTAPYFIHTAHGHFLDSAGRTLLLRGVNLSGSAKAPLGKPSYVFDGVAQDGGESFQSRPLNLDDGSADVHLARLRGWGFNMLRYVVTWESLEHAGPGKYDYSYMDYTVAVLRKCKEYGFRVFIDPHQDVWSRFSGGSGAPYWTLPACGIDPEGFAATKAAIVHAEYPNREHPDPASLPAMIWSTNYNRLLSQTMFTLFFAGREFAPKCILDSMNIQDWLQSHYIAAFGQLADRIRDAGDLLDECVIGWDSMNEPFEGFCGNKDLNVAPTETTSTFKTGPTPTPAQSLRLGMGQSQTVDTWNFGMFGSRKDGSVTLDPQGVTIWAKPWIETADGLNEKWGWTRDLGWKLGTCVWAQHGVWDINSGEICRPDYFSRVSGHEGGFLEDYWKPHWKLFSKRIRESHPESIMFIQPSVFSMPPRIDSDDLKGRCAYSAHYYDGLTLISRHWNWFNADALGLLRGKYKTILQAIKIGEPAIRRSLQQQLGVLKEDAKIIGDYPTIIGEIGTPFDMDGKRSYGWTDDGKYQGDYSNQQKALDASMNAADGPNALNYVMWTYCPDNSHMWGDGWNMEDLSIWSSDDLRNKSGLTTLNEAYPNFIPKGGIYGGFQRKSKSESAGTSSVSLTTLSNFRGGDEAIPKPSASSAGWENPYEFLTDGARAVKAFCRPWPIAVVGVTKDINFDISKAELTLTVVVRSDDISAEQRMRAERISVESSFSTSSSSFSTPFPEQSPSTRPKYSTPTPSWSSSTEFLQLGDDEYGAEMATEIYVPIVHYAHQKLVAKSCGESSSTECFESDGLENEQSCPLAPSSSAFTSSATLLANPLTSDSNLLNIHVEISGGKWSVSGQVLRWTYPVPEEGEEEKEYTISISRAGGPIKTLEEKDNESRRGWFERLCSSICAPEGCCDIM